jgi:hypothetical protein
MVTKKRNVGADFIRQKYGGFMSALERGKSARNMADKSHPYEVILNSVQICVKIYFRIHGWSDYLRIGKAIAKIKWVKGGENARKVYIKEVSIEGNFQKTIIHEKKRGTGR